MKKEALFAIIIGILLGLAATYGIYTLRAKLLPRTDSVALNASPLPSASPEQVNKLLITAPENEMVLSETKTTISGTAESQELIVIYVNNREYFTQADEIGAFAAEVTLDSGSNIMTVTAIAADGQQRSEELAVIVSTVNLDGTPTASSSATPEEDE